MKQGLIAGKFIVSDEAYESLKKIKKSKKLKLWLKKRYKLQAGKGE